MLRQAYRLAPVPQYLQGAAAASFKTAEDEAYGPFTGPGWQTITYRPQQTDAARGSGACYAGTKSAL